MGSENSVTASGTVSGRGRSAQAGVPQGFRSRRPLPGDVANVLQDPAMDGMDEGVGPEGPVGQRAHVERVAGPAVPTSNRRPGCR